MLGWGKSYSSRSVRGDESNLPSRMSSLSLRSEKKGGRKGLTNGDDVDNRRSPLVCWRVLAHDALGSIEVLGELLKPVHHLRLSDVSSEYKETEGACHRHARRELVRRRGRDVDHLGREEPLPDGELRGEFLLGLDGTCAADEDRIGIVDRHSRRETVSWGSRAGG